MPFEFAAFSISLHQQWLHGVVGDREWRRYPLAWPLLAASAACAASLWRRGSSSGYPVPPNCSGRPSVKQFFVSWQTGLFWLEGARDSAYSARWS